MIIGFSLLDSEKRVHVIRLLTSAVSLRRRKELIMVYSKEVSRED